MCVCVCVCVCDVCRRLSIDFIFIHLSTFNKQEGVLYLLLEYAEMDLNAVLKSHTTANRMATVLYFWNQMLEVVKVHIIPAIT